MTLGFTFTVCPWWLQKAGVHPLLPAPSCVPGTPKVLLPFPLGALGLSLADANPWWPPPLGWWRWDREGVPWWQREEEPGARGCDGDCWRHHHTIGSLSTATSKTLILWALRNAHPRESAQLHPDDLWQ